MKQDPKETEEARMLRDNQAADIWTATVQPIFAGALEANTAWRRQGCPEPAPIVTVTRRQLEEIEKWRVLTTGNIQTCAMIAGLMVAVKD